MNFNAIPDWDVLAVSIALATNVVITIYLAYKVSQILGREKLQ